MGVKFATPIFDGASLDQIANILKKPEYPDLVKPICMMVKPVNDSTNLQL